MMPFELLTANVLKILKNIKSKAENFNNNRRKSPSAPEENALMMYRPTALRPGCRLTQLP